MKIITTTLLLSLLCTSCMGRRTFHRAKYTFKVIDSETGKPITNGVVKSVFRYLYNGNYPDDPKSVAIVPLNNNGNAYFNVKSDMGTIGGSVWVKGYYPGGGGIKGYAKYNRLLNRWEPWDPTIEVKLRPIKNPVPMVHKQFLWNIKIPVFNKPVGFDLVVGDWVAPYGKGKVSDFIFNVTPQSKPKLGIKYKLTFSNQTDGIQEYKKILNQPYSFNLPFYKAPEDGYKNELKKYSYIKYPIVRNFSDTNISDSTNYIFRVRSHKNKEGHIVGYYGYLNRDIHLAQKGSFNFEYWLNTNSTSRSLEWIGNVPHDQQKNYK